MNDTDRTVDVVECELCGIDKRTLYFQLRHRGRSAGGITLCERCWRSSRNRTLHRRPWQRRLNDAQRAEICAAPRYRGMAAELARRYGVNERTIHKVRSGG